MFIYQFTVKLHSALEVLRNRAL